MTGESAPDLDLLDLIVATASLDEREREAFIDHALVGRSYVDIGRDLGVGHERARQIADGAVRKLSAMLARRAA